VSETTTPQIGSIGWIDLTVEKAEQICDFYRRVTGWEFSPVDMGGYHDFCMDQPEDGKSVAGICHKRGSNAELPSQWLIYITVANLEQSIARCTEGGGQLLAGPKNYAGQGRYCVIQDPAGAVAALFEPKQEV
jgi:predicted enzyme related to lactoylglutathione lyase